MSENNDTIDWQAVADYGCKFVIVRCSYGQSHTDELFQTNVKGAHDAGLICGAYHYSYALTPDQAIEEANHAKDVIANAGIELSLPIFFDMEDADHYKENHSFNFDNSYITSICKAWIDNIGLNTGVYASESWFDDYINWKELGCSVWNASWLSNPNADPSLHTGNDGIQGMLWQFTDSLNIDGNLFDGDWKY